MCMQVGLCRFTQHTRVYIDVSNLGCHSSKAVCLVLLLLLFSICLFVLFCF